ncbi:MAG: hypothetical protein RIQ52_570 [Pseudomonadota bacterium]
MTADSRQQLDAYYRQIQTVILSRQDWLSGLLPASTAVTKHGDYNDAWVRDNVYSILAVWGLALAYRREGHTPARSHVLEQSVVKLMRGLMFAMMRQADKVERFKHTQSPLDALHAKYNTHTGETVVGDAEWGHLQLDATSLYLLMLAQMTASGLRIIFTLDEVSFIQNLVHYISRTYRTPDFGIWERGHKMNHGIAELNASSIGMAKAALEAMAGFNLFGIPEDQTATIHVIPDDIARTRISLESLLPRESLSKEVDAAVLSVTGYPAFAVDSPQLKARTEALIGEKLEGLYGCRRFLLDGHQTVLEDHGRLHYEDEELQQFRDIECEWPLFFCYRLLNALFAGDTDAAVHYRQRLAQLCVQLDGEALLPELYFVPDDRIEAERQIPHSQIRLPNENIPLVWAQSLYLLACLIDDGFISLQDIDPIGRSVKSLKSGDKHLHVVLIAENDHVKYLLQTHGIPAQTRESIAPVRILDASELAGIYYQTGLNEKMGLTGRPLRQLRTLATSCCYQTDDEALLFWPQFMNQKGFYISMDHTLLIERLRTELAYIHRHWDEEGAPLLLFDIRESMLEGQDSALIMDFLEALKSGRVGDIPLHTSHLADILRDVQKKRVTSPHAAAGYPGEAVEEYLLQAGLLPAADFLQQPPESWTLTELENDGDTDLMNRLFAARNPYVQLEILSLLLARHHAGLEIVDARQSEAATLAALLEDMYLCAGNAGCWYIVRRCAGLLGKYDINLEQAVTDITVHHHGLTVGRAYSNKATLRRPADSTEILAAIRNFNPDDISQQIIVQEIIIYLGMLIKQNPALFADMHTIRVGHILQLLVARQKRLGNTSMHQAFTDILALAPHRLLEQLRLTLQDYSRSEADLEQLETLHYESGQGQLSSTRFTEAMDPPDFGGADDWYDWRERQGSVGREGEGFYHGIWVLLHHCKGLMIGEKYNSKRHIDSQALLARMTAGEQAFRLHINHIMNKIQAPVYRQLSVETLRALSLILRDNPEVHIDDTLVTDVLIGHAVRIHWLNSHPAWREHYDECVSLAWQSFYQSPPHAVANAVRDALIFLLNPEKP